MGKDLNGKEIGKGITQRKDGRYMARIKVEKNRSPITLYDFELEKLREKYYEERRKWNSGELTNSGKMTVRNWFKEWIKVYGINFKDTTKQNYITNYERIDEYIGHLTLEGIRQSHIQHALNILVEKNYAYTTIVSSKETLYAMFNKAVSLQFILRNPCVGVVLPKKPITSINALTKDEEVKFFNAITGQRYEELFYILLHTGMRIGEAVALTWNDIDFTDKKIYINKTLNRAKQYDRNGNKLNSQRMRITSTKTTSSNRVIPLFDNVELAFMKWKIKQDKDKVRSMEDWGRNNYLSAKYPNMIFTTRSGCPLTPTDAWTYCAQGVNRINEEEVIAAKLENREPKLLILHPHIFRHTFATRCMESGMNPEAVRKLLGHASLKMLEVYCHPSIDFVVDECNKYLEKNDIISNDKSIIMPDSNKVIFFPNRKSV